MQSTIAGGPDAGSATASSNVSASASSSLSGAAPPRPVALRDAGDPFAAAVADALRACGVRLEDAASPVVLIGGDAVLCGAELLRGTGLVAIGDAAARVLGSSGWTVRAIRPEHGRLVRCLPTSAAPVSMQRPPFVAMRYATLALDTAPDGEGDDGRWQVWVRDDNANPLVLADADRRIVCLLIRPESLLSDIAALDVLKAALAFAATPRD